MAQDGTLNHDADDKKKNKYQPPGRILRKKSLNDQGAASQRRQSDQRPIQKEADQYHADDSADHIDDSAERSCIQP